jgi:hypothetical protein
MLLENEVRLARIWRHMAAPRFCPPYVRRVRVGVGKGLAHDTTCVTTNGLFCSGCAHIQQSLAAGDDWRTWHLDLPTTDVITVQKLGTTAPYAVTKNGTTYKLPSTVIAKGVVAVVTWVARAVMHEQYATEIAAYNEYKTVIANRAQHFGLAPPFTHDALLWRFQRLGIGSNTQELVTAAVWVAFDKHPCPLLTLTNGHNKTQRIWRAATATSFVQEAAHALDDANKKLLHCNNNSGTNQTTTGTVVRVPRATVSLETPLPVADHLATSDVIRHVVNRLAPFLPAVPPSPKPDVFCMAILGRLNQRPPTAMVTIITEVYAMAYGMPLPLPIQHAIKHLATTVLVS